MILLDDELVADLTSEEDQFNLYKEIELQNLQKRSILLAYQIIDDQLEKYDSL